MPSKLVEVAGVLALLGTLSLAAAAEPCLVVPQASGGSSDQALLKDWSAEDLQLLVDEYAYSKDFRRHQDALSAGFELGDVVYDERIARESAFRTQAVRKWKQAYVDGRRRDFVTRIAPMLGNRAPDLPLVKTALNSCLRAPAWGKVEPLDYCHFAFSAGLTAASKSMVVAPVRLSVVGGRCSPWPNRLLAARGHLVRCERSGNGSVTVTLDTTRGQPARGLLPALKVRSVPDEPVLEEKTVTQVEVVALYRSRDYRVMEYGRGCPHCRLYAAEIRPSVPGASIVSVGVVSSRGGPGWHRCPADFRCGAAEFSPVDQRNASSCAGLAACRVWRLSEDDSEGQDTIQITYEGKVSACRNCPAGVSFKDAHRRWEQAKAEAGAACAVFEDPPPQKLSVSTTR